MQLSVSPSWRRAPSGTHNHIFKYVRPDHYGVSHGAPSLTRGWVFLLPVILSTSNEYFLQVQVTLQLTVSASWLRALCGTHDHTKCVRSSSILLVVDCHCLVHKTLNNTHKFYEVPYMNKLCARPHVSPGFVKQSMPYLSNLCYR